MPTHRAPAPPADRVLVVDDDPAVRDVVSRHLERAGYEVVQSPSGREALEALRDGLTVHAVVSDVEMADGSGGWLLAQLGYEYPSLVPRTVVITGDPHGARAAHIATRWRCPVLAKPFTGAQLLAALQG